MANERFVFVVGFDYEKTGVDFRLICDTRRKLMLKSFPDATFVIFDVAAGEVVTNEQPATPPKAKKKPARVVTTDKTTFKPVTKKNYSGKNLAHPDDFDTAPAGVMSITDVYQAIIDIGAAKATKGTLVEFGVFSHGYYGGSILVNSRDTSRTKKRDPDDKDSRSKDFLTQNMTAKELKNFQAAFATDSSSRLWGCSFTTSYRRVITTTIKSSKYRKTAPAKLKDSDEFEFDYSQDDAKDFFGDDLTFFPAAKAVTVTENKKKVTKMVYPAPFKRTLKDIKGLLKRGVDDSYAKALATASGRKVFSAFLGTYADYESNDPSVKLPVMVVPRKKPPFADNFTTVIEFYTKVIKIPEDPESRGYGTVPP